MTLPPYTGGHFAGRSLRSSDIEYTTPTPEEYPPTGEASVRCATHKTWVRLSTQV
jgi:hypothetical protein